MVFMSLSYLLSLLLIQHRNTIRLLPSQFEQQHVVEASNSIVQYCKAVPLKLREHTHRHLLGPFVKQYYIMHAQQWNTIPQPTQNINFFYCSFRCPLQQQYYYCNYSCLICAPAISLTLKPLLFTLPCKHLWAYIQKLYYGTEPTTERDD